MENLKLATIPRVREEQPGVIGKCQREQEKELFIASPLTSSCVFTSSYLGVYVSKSYHEVCDVDAIISVPYSTFLFIASLPPSPPLLHWQVLVNT